MFKPSQHPAFNMVYNMLYDMFELFTPAFNTYLIRSSLRIWSHLLKKFLMENFFFCAMAVDCWVAYKEAPPYMFDKVLISKTALIFNFVAPNKC